MADGEQIIKLDDGRWKDSRSRLRLIAVRQRTLTTSLPRSSPCPTGREEMNLHSSNDSRVWFPTLFSRLVDYLSSCVIAYALEVLELPVTEDVLNKQGVVAETEDNETVACTAYLREVILYAWMLHKKKCSRDQSKGESKR